MYDHYGVYNFATYESRWSVYNLATGVEESVTMALYCEYNGYSKTLIAYLTRDLSVALGTVQLESTCIHDICNVQPTNYKGVGSLLLNEIIVTFIIEQRWCVHDICNWTQRINLISTFEAMVFYHKFGFVLEDPDAMKPSYPNIPCETEGSLKAIEKCESCFRILH
jgi:hypothetical protein